MKALKLEKENVLKEKNALGVALQTCKKTLECSQQKFEKERNVLKNELEKLNVYKIEREAEIKQKKKAEKKMRQKASKEKVKKLDSHVNAWVSVETENRQIEYNSEHDENSNDTSKKGEEAEDILDTLQIEASDIHSNKSYDLRFLDFPEEFDDWSEDQQNDAYKNCFKLYLEKKTISYLKKP